ncbi:Aldehyde dehydrogenase [Lunasporangiospora selenospora]|uniref:Aldehyde dehydrogenase n=1 Tax=Lunasporangiospora selenospora TaxID=979761 RepID=A0A9P6G1F1_9FUNG|nr:Aldehyde dehydrogenase [Lunasporangiospora selenospora]
MTFTYTPIEEIPKIVAASKATFKTHRTQSLENRKEQLRALLRLVEENKVDLADAITKDLNRHSDFEIPTIITAVRDFIDNLENLTQPQKAAGVHEKDDCFVRLSPLGSVLIIGAWNFPIMLVLEPLAGAIAAGNTAVLKPSEVSVNSAQLLTRLVQKYMDPAVVSVINGGKDETTVLLQQRFDHIFYTGGTEVGRIVMQAAAKNLTPVTLELGGKCPAIVTDRVDLVKTAQRIAGWKTLNCGQVCLSVDYVLISKALEAPFIEAVQATWKHLFGDNPRTCATYPKIVSVRQTERLEKLLQSIKKENNIICGGETNVAERYVAPTIVTNVSLTDEVMKDEIFGPILPIVVCDDLNGAIDIINQGEHPLGLYLFSDDKDQQEQVLRETRSGAVCINDIACHFLNHSLPFGGVGNSGIGNYHGRYSIDTFSHKRAVMTRSIAHL